MDARKTPGTASHLNPAPRRRAGLALAAIGLLLGVARSPAQRAAAPAAARPAVGPVGPGEWLTPTEQVLAPAGRQIALPGVRPVAIALSPDGGVLVTAGMTSELCVLDPQSGELRARVKLPPDPANRPHIGENAATNLDPDKPDRMSFGGLVFSPDGRRLYFSNVNGSIKVFAIDAAHRLTPAGVLPVPPANAPHREAEIPAGLAISPDGKRLYVAGNLGNRLWELDAATGTALRHWDVGVAPLDVVLVGTKVYVSNLGGRRPADGALTGPAGRGTTVRVDARSIASEGSVSVIDLTAGTVRAEVLVGRHASALAASPNGRYVVVANAGDDTVSVIDTRTDGIVENIWARHAPTDLTGAQPCALAFAPNGRTLYVGNSAQNAVAVVHFEPDEHESAVTGLIPTAWFPSALVFDPARRQLAVANLKGIGAYHEPAPDQPVRFRSKDFFGTVSLIPLPDSRELQRYTERVVQDSRLARLAEAMQPPRPDQPPQPVPARVGERSVFRHVIYVLKENRTYDQVLGDVREGNGDASLCTFGAEVTPNQHALAREFVLLDNTYCAGVQSSDGHQWTDSGFANEYAERQVSNGASRSYSSGKDPSGADALAYASNGFIWDQVQARGLSFRNYGEWMTTDAGWRDPQRKGRPTWIDFWRDFHEGRQDTKLGSHAAIAALAPVSPTHTVGWDLRVPDVVRAREFIADLQAAETSGDLPTFTLLFLPNDHTGGTRASSPTPRAQVADNDLALGRVVDALSHSRFWRDTCLIAIEDDPQAGWDHVSGYRTTCYVASAYTKRHAVVSTLYSQLSVLRTMELMLGVPPLNQLDATATPMSDCFTGTPDLTPFNAVPNRVALDEMNVPPKRAASARQRADALASARLPLDQPDQCDEGTLNEILWRAARGEHVPYPRWAVKSDPDGE